MRRLTQNNPGLWVLAGVLSLAGCKVGDVDDIDVDFDEDASIFDDAAAPRDDGSTAFDAGRDGGTSTQSDASKPPIEEDAGSSSMEPGETDALAAMLAKATCDALEDCYGDENLLVDTLGGFDCVSLNENLLRNGELRYLEDSVAAGLVLYRPEQLSPCLSDIRSKGCLVRGSRLPASCQLMLIGTVDTGAACTINRDCSGDAFCDKGQEASCPGYCAALQGPGMPCHHDDDEQCEDGLTCFRGSCEALGEAGDECGDDVQRCRPGLECIETDDGNQCTQLRDIYVHVLDEACDPVMLELCEPGLVCESTEGSMGVCAEPVAKGASCKRAKPNQCPLSQYCDAEAPGESGTCVDMPGDGEPCLDRDIQCADGHLCIDDVCHELLQVAQSCTESAECYSGICGDAATCEGPLMCDAP